MARDAQKLRELRNAYVRGGQSLPVAALGVNVPEGTARRWKREAAEKGDDWDMARIALTVQGQGRDALLTKAVEGFVVQFQAAMDNIAERGDVEPLIRVDMMAKLADAFTKTVSAAGRVSPKISRLGVALDVLKDFGEFVRRHHPEGVETLLAALEDFGATLSEDGK